MAMVAVTDIPKIMDANRWPVAATLLRRWFAAAANSIPSKGLPCLEIVTMDWVLSFERVKAAYSGIFDQGLWKNQNARNEMRKVLQRKGRMLTAASSAYTRADVRLPLSHPDHVQFVSVGGGSWDMAAAPIDHLTAALARFNFHIVLMGLVAGPAKPGQTARFHVHEVGVYVRDSYDFNDDAGDDQELGNWNATDNTVGRTWLNGGTTIKNSDFRKWRDKYKKGSDYLIFSDVRYTRLAKPEVIEL